MSPNRIGYAWRLGCFMQPTWSLLSQIRISGMFRTSFVEYRIYIIFEEHLFDLPFTICQVFPKKIVVPLWEIRVLWGNLYYFRRTSIWPSTQKAVRAAFKIIDTKTLFCLCKPQTGHQTLNYIFFFTMIYKVYLLAFTLPGGINPNANPCKWQILFSLIFVAHVLDLRGIEVTWFAQICLMLEAKPGDGH